jgi:uncharacterized Zn finger protein (UPF0148 family)
MNVTGSEQDQWIRLDLKYCERCGGLFLRSEGTSGVYCGSCSAHFAQRPAPGETSPLKRRRRRTRKASAVQREETENSLTACNGTVSSVTEVSA